jgi:hypothetical protein
MISAAERAALLAFVDKEVPPGSVAVYLTGSRARGDSGPNSDWDVLVLHPDAADDKYDVFSKGTGAGPGPDGNLIELVIARPHRLDNDPRPYFVGCKRYGIKLR